MRRCRAAGRPAPRRLASAGEGVRRAMRYGMFDQIEVSGEPLHELYRDRLALVRAAEEAGFERYHKSEHHMIRLDAVPQLGLFFAAAAQHTTRIRFGSLVYLLPFHHPIRLAEEIATLDHLLEGRFDVGVGRGISLPEQELWGLDTDRVAETFDETLAVLRAALTTDVLTFHGERYHFDELPIILRPYQQPQPPWWYPGNIVAAAAGGMSCIVGGPIPLIARQVAAYRAACADGRRGAGPGARCLGGVHRPLVDAVPAVGPDPAARPDARRRCRSRPPARRAVAGSPATVGEHL